MLAWCEIVPTPAGGCILHSARSSQLQSHQHTRIIIVCSSYIHIHTRHRFPEALLCFWHVHWILDQVLSLYPAKCSPHTMQCTPRRRCVVDIWRWFRCWLSSSRVNLFNLSFFYGWFEDWRLKNFPGVYPTIFKPSSNQLPSSLWFAEAEPVALPLSGSGRWFEDCLKIGWHTPDKFFNLHSSNHPFEIS